LVLIWANNGAQQKRQAMTRIGFFIVTIIF